MWLDDSDSRTSRPSSAPPVPASIPAHGAVGEPIPISALVFREGHDAVGANVVLRDPAGRKAAPIRMDKGAPGTDRWHATVIADRIGQWSFAVEAWSDPMSTWHHAVTTKIEAGQGTEDLANDLEDGARLFDRLAKSLPKDERPRASAAAKALRDTTLDVGTSGRPCARRLPAGTRPRVPGARSGDQFAALPAVDRPQPRPVRFVVRVLPALDRRRVGRRPDRAGAARTPRHVQGLRRTSRLRRVHGLRRRVSPADPPDRAGQSQGTEQHARGRQLGRRLALGHRFERGRPRRDPSRAGDDGRLPGAREAREGTRHGDRARPRVAVRARSPVGREPSRVVHDHVRTVRSPTPRTRRRSTRTSIRSTSTTTARAFTTSACE